MVKVNKRRDKTCFGSRALKITYIANIERVLNSGTRGFGAMALAAYRCFACDVLGHPNCSYRICVHLSGR
jgi:hypothetical protein